MNCPNCDGECERNGTELFYGPWSCNWCSWEEDLRKDNMANVSAKEQGENDSNA